jgi:hypothetical protein
MTEVLGLTLAEALEESQREGLPRPLVVCLQPEKHPEGTERVVRVRSGELLVARFPDRVAG